MQFELSQSPFTTDVLSRQLRLSEALQAFGNAVLEEVRVFALSTYTATVFFQRSADPTNKDLACSPIIYSDGRNGLPPKACWLYVLSEAAKLKARPGSLARELVPSTRQGRSLTYQLPAASSGSPPGSDNERDRMSTRKRPLADMEDHNLSKAKAPCRCSHEPADGQAWSGQGALSSCAPLTWNAPGAEGSSKIPNPLPQSAVASSQGHQPMPTVSSPSAQIPQPCYSHENPQPSQQHDVGPPFNSSSAQTQLSPQHDVELHVGLASAQEPHSSQQLPRHNVQPPCCSLSAPHSRTSMQPDLELKWEELDGLKLKGPTIPGQFGFSVKVSPLSITWWITHLISLASRLLKKGCRVLVDGWGSSFVPCPE